MTNLLVRLFFAAMACLSLGTAHAQVIVPDIYWGVTAGGIKYYDFDATLACKEVIAASNGYSFDSARMQTTSIYNCYAIKPPATVATNYANVLRNQCTQANPYFNNDTNVCVNTKPPEADPCSDKNEFIRRWDYPAGGVTPPPNNYSGCEITVIKMLVCRKDPSGMTYCMWLVKRTGEKYTGPPTDGGGQGSPAPDDPKAPPANSPPIKPPPGKSCPVGSVQAGSSSDGTPICMGQGSNPQNPQPAPPKVESEKNEPMPDGGTKNTKTTTTTNSDGSTTTNTTVTITKADGSKESSGGSTTTANSAGLPGTADVPEDDKFDLCKQNPHLSICRESTVAGSCGEITCVGDAIQCATLRAAATMECKQRADEQALKDSPLTAKGNAAISGSDIIGDNLPTAKNATVVTLPGAGDTSGWLGGGSPFDDVSFTVFGHSITLPFAKWSGYLIALRYALMVAASLISFRILSGSILRE